MAQNLVTSANWFMLFPLSSGSALLRQCADWLSVSTSLILVARAAADYNSAELVRQTASSCLFPYVRWDFAQISIASGRRVPSAALFTDRAVAVSTA